MKLRTRLTILTIFILGFLITAPILVLYTAGYRYSFTTRSIVQTGLLYVTSIPKGAMVLVNDKDRIRTPDFIKNLVPGEYEVDINKTGYHTWSKTLPVTSRETTFIEEVILFLNSNPVNLIPENIIYSQIDPTGAAIAFVTSLPSWLEIWSYNPGTATQTLLYRVADETDLTATTDWSADGERVLVSIAAGDTNDFVIIDKIGFARTQISEITDEDVTDVWWHPNDPQAFFFTSEDATWLYRIPNQTPTKIYDSPVLSTLIEGQPVIIESSDSRTSVFRYLNESADIIAYLPIGEYKLLNAADPYLLLHEINKDKLILINTASGDDPILLNTNGIDARWAIDGSEDLLYFSNFEVNIYSPNTHSDQLITRVGEEITGAAWHPLGNAIIISKNSVVQAIELDSRDQRNVIDLTTGNNISNIWIEKTGRRAYFIGEVDPDRGIFELPISER